MYTHPSCLFSIGLNIEFKRKLTVLSDEFSCVNALKKTTANKAAV